MASNREYARECLGDGVYISLVDDSLYLTTGAHDNIESAIYLDAEIVNKLYSFCKSHKVL